MINIRNLNPSDWDDVRRIYLEGIETGSATFEISAPSWKDWDKSHVKDLRLAAAVSGKLVGWAALTAVSGRCVYAGVAEVSVYVGSDFRGMRIGSALLNALIKQSEEKGYWTLQAGIFPENEASIALHRRCGFKQLGVRERVGKLHGKWKDVAILERRSTTVGID